ncbi:MAG: DUF3060 domain-containing protein [Mycobacterium sp.]
MVQEDDPEERIRELERPLADTARASQAYSAGAPAPPPPTPPTPWTYGGPFPGPPPQRGTGNRMWWILGTVIVVGMLALAAGIAAFAAHQFSGVRSIIESPPSTTGAPTTPGASTGASTGKAGPSTSPQPPPGGRVSISGVNENRTLACNDNTVSVSGVSNTVVITGHCARISVSGVQNAITVDSVDAIDASGFNNKVTYHSGAPKIGNSGDSNAVGQG